MPVTPTSRAGRCTSTCPPSPRFGQLSHLSRPEMLALAAEHGGKPDDPNKRDPLDFVLWQPSAARRAVLGVALGTRPAGLAHRVLGPGHARAGRHHRSPRGWPRPHLPPPRVRDGAVGVGHRARPSAVTGSTSVWSVWTAPRCRSRSATSCSWATCLKEWEPMAVRLALLEHHYRADWEWDGSRPRPCRRAPRAVASAPGRRRRRRRSRTVRRSPRRRPRRPGRPGGARRDGGHRAGVAQGAALLGVTL